MARIANPHPSRSPLRALIAAAALAILLSACGGTPTVEDPGTVGTGTASTGTSEQTDEPSTGATEPTTETFEEPETEDPDATEDADGGNGGGVSVDLPGLPIGGNAEPADASDPTRRCAEVNWTGLPADPPAEVNLTLTELGTYPPGVYEIVDGGCGGDLGPCLDRPGAVTGGNRCAVGIRQVAASPDEVGALFVTSGTISCAPGEEAICDQFQTDLASNAELGRIEWFDALSEWPPTPETEDGTDDGDDDGGTGGTGGTAGTEDTGDEVDPTQAP